MSSTGRRIALNVFYLGTSQGVAWLLNSLYIIVIPRYLGPAGIGTLTLLGAVGAIVNSIAGMGINTYLLREVARDPERSKVLIGTNIIISTVLCVIGWGGVIVVISLLPEAQDVRQVLYIYAITYVLSISITPLQAALQGLEKMHYPLITTFINKGLRVVLAVTFAALNLGLVLVASVDLFCIIPLVWLYIRWFNKHSQAVFTTDPAPYKELIKGGLPFLIYEVSINIYLQLDQLLLAGLVSQEMVGYYGVAFRLMGTFMVIPTVVGNAILPTLSRMAVDTSDGKMHDTSRKLLTFTLCASLPVSVGCTVMAEPFISLVYGAKFAPTIPIMVILGWTVAPTYLGMGLYQIMVAQDRQTRWIKILIVGVIVNLLLNLGMIPLWQSLTGNGGIGAAISLLLTELFIAGCGLWLVGREVTNRQLGLNMLKSFGAALLMGVVVWPLRDTPIVIPVLTGVIVYGLGVVAFGLVQFSQIRLAFGLAGRLKQRFTGAK